ncbi:MAG: hypothetical protein HC903_27040 [Methylacidiphilales bacterium]|nr:hypothetical protein [Candidatus Methylacidiphilales bacterium]
MKKYLLFLVLLLASIPLPVFAQITGHLGNGYFYIKGLEPSKPYEVGLGGMPFIRSGLSDSCGVVQIRPRRSLQSNEKVEILDGNSSYSFVNNAIAVRDNYKCAKQIEARAVWKNSAGLVFVAGFTPSKALTIRFLGDNPNRTVTSNFCGFIRLVLQNPIPKAIFLDNKALSTQGTPGSNFACNKNNLYVSYPKIIQPVVENDKTTWVAQNPVEPSPNTTNINNANGGNTNNEPAIYINQDDELILTGKTPGRTIEAIYNGNSNVQGSGEVTVDSCGRARMFALFIYGVGFIPTSYTITAPTTIVEKHLGIEVARYQIQPSQIQRNVNFNLTCS